MQITNVEGGSISFSRNFELLRKHCLVIHYSCNACNKGAMHESCDERELPPSAAMCQRTHCNVSPWGKATTPMRCSAIQYALGFSSILEV